MICHRSQMGPLCSTRPERQEHWEFFVVCRQASENVPKTAQFILNRIGEKHTDTATERTHTRSHTMVEQKRHDCTQCATGLAVLFENPGALDLILLPLQLFMPASTCLAALLSPCATAFSFSHLPPHTQTVTLRELYTLSEKEGCAICSNRLL